MNISQAQIRKNVAKKLKELRASYKVSQKEVSNMLGVNDATYRNWENERATPSITKLYELSKMFKTSVGEICGIEESGEKRTGVASPDEFNKNIYGENKITDLDNYEKQLVMQIRRLTNDDRRKVGECINELLKKEDE